MYIFFQNYNITAVLTSTFLYPLKIQDSEQSVRSVECVTAMLTKRLHRF